MLWGSGTSSLGPTETVTSTFTGTISTPVSMKRLKDCPILDIEGTRSRASSVPALNSGVQKARRLGVLLQSSDRMTVRASRPHEYKCWTEHMGYACSEFNSPAA